MTTELLILVAEHNVRLRTALVVMLDELGFKTECAADGREAIRRFQEREYSLVLMDIDMPELDGCDTTALIRAFEKEHDRGRTPIIGLTAGSVVTKRHCIDAGMNDMYQKSLSKEQLHRVCTKWLQRTDVE